MRRIHGFVAGIVGVTGLVLAAPASAQQFLETDLPNNGLSAAGVGIFLDLTSINDPLAFTGLQYYASSTAGANLTLEVWIKNGTYVGFDQNQAAWTLHETLSGTSNGTGTLTDLISFNNPVNIGAGETVGIYLIAQAGGIRYTGATGAQPFWSDNNIELFSDLARNAPWGGTAFTPRVYAGRIWYDIIPAPGAIALLGLAGVCGVSRRRRA